MKLREAIKTSVFIRNIYLEIRIWLTENSHYQQGCLSKRVNELHTCREGGIFHEENDPMPT